MSQSSNGPARMQFIERIRTRAGNVLTFWNEHEQKQELIVTPNDPNCALGSWFDVVIDKEGVWWMWQVQDASILPAAVTGKGRLFSLPSNTGGLQGRRRKSRPIQMHPSSAGLSSA